jgi:hypothetical protein
MKGHKEGHHLVRDSAKWAVWHCVPVKVSGCLHRGPHCGLQRCRPINGTVRMSEVPWSAVRLQLVHFIKMRRDCSDLCVTLSISNTSSLLKYLLHVQRVPSSIPTISNENFNVFARSNVGIVGSNLTQSTDVCLHLFCVCVVLCRQRPCVGLIPSARSPT